MVKIGIQEKKQVEIQQIKRENSFVVRQNKLKMTYD